MSFVVSASQKSIFKKKLHIKRVSRRVGEAESGGARGSSACELNTIVQSRGWGGLGGVDGGGQSWQRVVNLFVFECHKLIFYGRSVREEIPGSSAIFSLFDQTCCQSGDGLDVKARVAAVDTKKQTV